MSTTITNAKERAEFRRTPIWQVFRRYLCTTRGMTCEFCGVRYKRMCDLNIHHKFETHYDNLDQHRFMLLCKTCHEFIHRKYKAPAFAERALYGNRD